MNDPTVAPRTAETGDAPAPVELGEAWSPDPLPRPLDGLLVIETASFLTGAISGLILADLGADVVKIEPPGGDGFRKFGHNRDGLSAIWTNANRGKRSVVLDLKSPADLEALKGLLRKADILVENWRPRVTQSLGLGQDVVGQINPRLVRLSITGYGDTGNLANAPAFDSLIQGRTGLIAAETQNGVPGVTPFNMVDKVTGAFGVQSVLAALYAREKTGRGAHVKLPMLDVLAYFNFCDMFQHRTFAGDQSPWVPPVAQVLRTADGFVVISPANGPQMTKTLEAVGHLEWREELRRIPDRVAMSEEFFRRVGAAVRERSTAYWLDRFRETDVPAAPIMDFDEHLDDPQVRNNRLYGTLDSPVGPVRSVRYPGSFDGHLLTPRRPAPDVGEHQAEIAKRAEP